MDWFNAHPDYAWYGLILFCIGLIVVATYKLIRNTRISNKWRKTLNVGDTVTYRHRDGHITGTLTKIDGDKCDVSFTLPMNRLSPTDEVFNKGI